MTDNPIITSPVLIPLTPDCEYRYGEDVLPPEKIEYLAKSFNKYKIIDLQHEFTKRLINHLEPVPRGKLLKSYISQDFLFLKGLDGSVRKYPKGTWIISVEITDPEAVRLYNDRELTGLSVTVKEKEHADTIQKYLNEHNVPYLPEHLVEAEKGFYRKPKRILMKDVVNPVAFTVSLVRSPCVYGAKFCKNSCLIVNQNKLKENKILNIKEKIKKEINSFIDGLDVDEESIKEDVTETVENEKEVSESEAIKTESEEIDEESVKTIYGRKVKVSESEKSEEKDSESVKEDSDGEEEGTETSSESEGEDTETDETDDSDEGTDAGKIKEAKKEDVTESESDKDVLYLAQDEVENLISTTLRRYAEEVEQMVFDGIQEALDDYLFSKDYAYKENTEEEPEEGETEPEEEEVEEESQKNYATPEMVQSMFDEQFSSFKSNIMDSIKKAQKESIKSYSKAIHQGDDGFEKESKKETFKPKVERDFNGCRIRKRK